MRISVVIPTLNEAENLPGALAAIPVNRHEVIVVDGGSTDATRDIAVASGCRVLNAGRGRALQMNRGAAEADGDVLLFLHADTHLPADAFSAVQSALADAHTVGGGFRLAIDSPEPFLEFVAAMTNRRCRRSRIMYGDQAPFVRRAVFQQLGGFPEVPILEDVMWGRRLRAAGTVRLLDGYVTTSARRWQTESPVYTTLRNRLLVTAHWLGVPPSVLAVYYRPHRATRRPSGDRMA